jgi:hypothetical protein
MNEEVIAGAVVAVPQKRKLAMLSRLADQRGAQSMQVSPKGVK